MSEDEVLDEVTSEELGVSEMLEHFEEEIDGNPVENPKDEPSNCKGNILTDCVRDGLQEVERAAEETDAEYTIIGGIATQLRGLADCRDILTIGDHFGRRQTADIDILVNERSEGVNMQRAYDEKGKPKMDIIYNHIPGDEEVIADSEMVDFGEIDERLDFTVSIKTNEEVNNTKDQNPSLEEKEGTRYDLKKYEELSGYVFDVDETRTREIVKERAPDTEATIDYLIRAGIDI